MDGWTWHGPLHRFFFRYSTDSDLRHLATRLAPPLHLVPCDHVFFLSLVEQRVESSIEGNQSKKTNACSKITRECPPLIPPSSLNLLVVFLCVCLCVCVCVFIFQNVPIDPTETFILVGLGVGIVSLLQPSMVLLSLSLSLSLEHGSVPKHGRNEREGRRSIFFSTAWRRRCMDASGTVHVSSVT